ncbi:MAG: DUF1631 family protein [Gammaproteobacteria bacterium]|nr:DUF1631 family protein [Gammaproteobacteria bacterium]MBL7001122.1 DUF1631 family protein [Gammaproteobacteria bacterium]
MIAAIKQFPKFIKGSPSSEFQQIINFSVNYLDGMLINLMHMEIPAELSTHQESITTLQQQLLTRERTVRHTFQFQLEKFFADFKSCQRTRIRSHHPRDMLLRGLATGQKASRIQDIIDTLSRKHQDIHNIQLDNTGRRLKTLVHRSDEIKDDNPLSPLKICQAFLASIETFNISSQKNRDLFLLLDYNLQHQLGNFYNQIDLGLYNLGILAELTDMALFDVPVNKPEPPSEQEANALPTTVENAQPALETSVELPLPEDSAALADNAELELAISEFRQATAQGTLQFSSLFDNFSTQMDLLLEPQQAQSIRSLLYFQRNLLTNARLSEALRLQLSRLSVALVELAMVDQGFYKTEDHPVNNLIISILDFEIRFEHKGESLLVLSRLISALLKTKAPVIEDYQPFIEEYDSFKLAEVKRLTKIKQAKIKEAKLQQQLLELVNEVTSDLVVDIPVMQFFYEDWQLYLLHLAQNDGTDSSEFHTALETARQLVWSLDESKKGEHPDHPETSFKSLLAAVDKGLLSLNYSGEHRHRTRKLLIDEFRRANKKQSFTIQQTPFKSALTSITPAPAQSKDRQQLNPDSIRIGDWLEFKMAHKKDYTRAKLKWKAADNTSFIFIDQRGHKVKQLNLFELQQDIAAGEIKFLRKSYTPNSFNG